MTTFASEYLHRIEVTEDLHISPFRADGTTYGTPTWIWSVVVDDELYVRAYNGTQSRWYQAATSQHAGRITAADTSLDVTFESAAAEGDLADAIDVAYHDKYDPSPYVTHMVGRGSRRATIRIRPRNQAVLPGVVRTRPAQRTLDDDRTSRAADTPTHSTPKPTL